MTWNVPNQLTVGRVVLALGFFVLLAFYQSQSAAGQWLLNAAFVVYIIAGITDVLDGYLARRWDQTSVFGRMVDPIVDKVLVIGAFAMLAGFNFSHAAAGEAVGQFEKDLPKWLTGGMSSAVQAWMVVGVLVRELVVSGVRGYSESQGRLFPATYGGKIKMFIQSVAICTVLYQMANLPMSPWAIIIKIVVVWLAVLVTILSGLMYMGKARAILEGPE